MVQLGAQCTAESPPRVEICLLGGFRMTHGGQRVRLPGSVQRLVAFLALSDQPGCRDLVAGTLWIDKTEERAHANLRQALWRLGRVDDDIIDRRGDQLAIRDDVTIDVREAVAQARRLVDPHATLLDSDLEPRARAGDLLPGWYEDWAVVARERHAQLRLYALEHLCLRLVALGRVAQAVDVGIACVAEEPLRESAQRALITAHFADGNWRDGIRQCERYETTLFTTLGLRPSQAMIDLVERVRDAHLAVGTV
jgi:DNA-binding SARP family transcriptional activator